jgi:hypothetical protein
LQAELRKAQIGHWYEPEHLFGYVMVIYFAKIVDEMKGATESDSGAELPVAYAMREIGTRGPEVGF